jgi:hypothetical protein
MIKVFDTTKEFETYSADGLKSGELCYVTEDKTAHFRTNNIDGVDKDYNMSEGGGSSEPVLIEGEFTENGTYEPEDADGYSSVVVNVAAPTPTYSELTFINGICENDTISCQDGDCFEIYNPNRGNLWIGVFSSTEMINMPIGYQGNNEHFYITCNSMKGFDNGGFDNPNQILVKTNSASADYNTFNGIVYYRKLN